MKFILLTTHQPAERKGDRFEIRPPVPHHVAAAAMERLIDTGVAATAEVQANDFGNEDQVADGGRWPVTRFLVTYPESVNSNADIGEAYRQVRAIVGEVVIAAYTLPPQE